LGIQNYDDDLSKIMLKNYDTKTIKNLQL